jgi:Papain-like cysteine protease AvrRpt2
MQHQQQTQWCWAATSVSVNLYYDPGTGNTQCLVANTVLDKTICCDDGSKCNQPNKLGKALTVVGNLNAIASGKASFATVKGEIDNCRPICLRIGWNGGGGHFVAIYGCTGDNIINIGDPWWGDSVVYYSKFPSGYHGGGSWTDSYTTKS